MALSAFYGVARTTAGTIIPSAAVEVRRTADNSLATIYGDAAGVTPINNGVDFVTDSSGVFEFYAEPDRYTVLVGSGASQVSVPAEIVDGRAQVPFESRADFVAWVAGGGVAADGTIKSDGTVQYVASAGATAIADLPGWLPFGQRRPAHDGLATTVNVPTDIATMQDVVDRYGADPVDAITINIEAGHSPESGIRLLGGDYSRYTISAADQATAFLYLTAAVSVSNGETISQASSGASGAVINATGSTRFLLLDSVSGTFDTTGELVGATSGALGAGSVPLISHENVVPVTTFSGDILRADFSQMPVLDCLFAGDGTNNLLSGYYAGNGSSGYVTPGSGVVGAWRNGCYAHGGSSVSCRFAVFDANAANGTTNANVHAWGSTIFADGVSARHSGYYGVQASHSGTMTFRDGDSSGANRYGLRVSDAGIMDAESAVVNDAGVGPGGSGVAIRCYEGSLISLSNVTCTGADVAISCIGGRVNLGGPTATPSVFDGAVNSVEVNQGGVICGSFGATLSGGPPLVLNGGQLLTQDSSAELKEIATINSTSTETTFDFNAPEITSAAGKYDVRFGRDTEQGTGENSRLIYYAHDGTDTEAWSGGSDGVVSVSSRMEVTASSSSGYSALACVNVNGGVSIQASSGPDTTTFVDMDAPDVSVSGGTVNYRLGRNTAAAGTCSFILYGHDGANTPKFTVNSLGVSRNHPVTVADLPSAGSSRAGAGARHFVTDATSTTFGSVVVGGGSESVPVYSDGTNWRIG